MTFTGKFISNHNMRDTLQIGTLTGGGDGAYATARTWTYDAVNTVKCFVKALTGRTGREVQDGSEVTLTDVQVMVPSDTDVTNLQRVRVTHKDRVALDTAEDYEVVGAPMRKRNLLALSCKRVTGNAR